MRIDESGIRSMKLSPENGLHLDEYLGEVGNQHYKLLAWLSTQFNGVDIFDIGTHMGASAAALSYNASNHVFSFDISHTHLKVRKANCTYSLENLWEPAVRETWKTRILESPLIFLDIDPHEGSMEFEFYTWLKANNYKGILILDDIWYFKGMRDNLWYHISDRKIDLTHIGHWSGTGIVDFSNQIEIDLPDTSNWTLVTAYFDLTKEHDASSGIKSRPLSHYLSTANATMGCEQNLIVFCDETTKPLLEALRPVHLRSKTKYIVQSFSDFDIVNTRSKIIENRKTHPYHFDDRNTASYYLFCMTRYLMINRAIEENPFQSSHFAWINVCIERMGWRNVMSLNSALAVNRDKFSTCYIDYQPKQLVQNYSEYFKFGRCGMCSGFFTGRADYFKEFNKRVLEAFYDCLEKGYGHADEQLFSIVYFQYPDIFEHYFGDYQQMITNYTSVVDNIEGPLRHVIRNSFIHKDWDICLKGCLSLLSSFNRLSNDNKRMFLKYSTVSAIHLQRWDILQQLLPNLEIYS